MDAEGNLHCCDSLSSRSESDITEAHGESTRLDEALRVEIKYLKQIIENKEQMINELQDKIVVLKKFNQLIDNPLKVSPPRSSHVHDNVISKKRHRSGDKSKKTHVHKNKNVEIGSNNAASRSVEVIDATSEEGDGENTTVIKYKDDNKDDETWSTVVRRRNRKTVICTKMQETDITSDGKKNVINAISKNAYIFVSRLSPNTTADEMISFLQDDYPEVKCAVLNSKYPESYSSFKVTVNLDNLERIMKTDQWPAGTIVTRFFHSKEKRNVLK